MFPFSKYICGLVFTALPLLAAYSAEVYRWTDKDGRTHYSNKVPDAQNSLAKPVDLSNARLSDADRRAALDRVEKEKSKLQKPAPASDTTIVAAPPKPAPTVVPQGPDFPSARRACEAEWTKYRESSACFAPFFQVNGSVKAEAYAVCTEMKMPALCN